MANILLLANINCDRILTLDKPLQTGGRFHYDDGGLRLGGGGANTGLGLVWAQHKVAVVSQVGEDDTGDWVLAKAGTLGLDCRMVQRYPGNTCEMLLVMTPDGERTIIRSKRPPFILPTQPKWQNWQGFYINSEAQNPAIWSTAAMAQNPDCLVVAQLGDAEQPLPCHVLIASLSDMQARCNCDFWQFGRKIAGENLRYFVVTDGENGAIAYSERSPINVAAVTTEVVDTTGAGDAYAAGMIDSLVHGQTMVKAMQQAAIWSSFAVATKSSVPGKALLAYIEQASQSEA
ncbi:PfkB family carbohydrate kinase [Shewanella intestini]|uniref:Ribokinase n=1 Tax=Shewanella intestini TaxID=2017544 RepID=A0ABS5I650_9GAMM|nr:MULTISPECIES: PfkB family carbohydrate kinase [Shewanella]MBR9729318.1 ribokinase [Shewanella intestini]MRG37397.1 ribokinase [Shewanella sp. XMDDZSB0408]